MVAFLRMELSGTQPKASHLWAEEKTKASSSTALLAESDLELDICAPRHRIF